jgi:hypothetical protein
MPGARVSAALAAAAYARFLTAADSEHGEDGEEPPFDAPEHRGMPLCIRRHIPYFGKGWVAMLKRITTHRGGARHPGNLSDAGASAVSCRSECHHAGIGFLAWSRLP